MYLSNTNTQLNSKQIFTHYLNIKSKTSLGGNAPINVLSINAKSHIETMVPHTHVQSDRYIIKRKKETELALNGGLFKLSNLKLNRRENIKTIAFINIISHLENEVFLQI